MLVTTLDAKAKLEAENLHVSCNDAHSLWIAANVREMEEGIGVSEDASALICKSGQWFAAFPAEGISIYEVPGSLEELVSLIVAVYNQYRNSGGPFKDAFKQVVSDPDQYLVGRSTVRV
jgi:hypothetical protein